MSIAEPVLKDRAVSDEPRSNEFSYTPVSPLAPVAAFFGVASLLAFLGFFGLFVALFGVCISVVAVMRVRAGGGTVGGKGMARMGLVLSAVSLILGSTMFGVAYATECPEGHLRVNFPNDIARNKFVFDRGVRQIHPDVAPLLEKPIFLKGYVYQSKQLGKSSSFILLKDNGKCCFGGEPQPFDMIQITLADGLSAEHFPVLSMVGVAGILHADPSAPPGAAVYKMDASHCEIARTSF